MGLIRKRMAVVVAAVTLLIVAMLVVQSRNGGWLPKLQSEAAQQAAWRARFVSDEDPDSMLRDVPAGNAELEASILVEALCHERAELSLAAYRTVQDRIDEWQLLPEADCQQRFCLFTVHLSQADFSQQPHSSRQATKLAGRVLLSLISQQGDKSQCQANCQKVLRRAADYGLPLPAHSGQHSWGDVLASELNVAMLRDQATPISSANLPFENEFSLPGGGIPLESGFGRTSIEPPMLELPLR